MSAQNLTFQERVGRMIRPRHIAFIGSVQSVGAIEACKRAGFKGDIWTVNPKRDQIAGIPCVPSIADLPEPPDTALLALSAERSVDAVRELSRMGAASAVCMAAGFAETGTEGNLLQEELLAAAGDMPVLGPNAMGLINQFDGAVVWGSGNHIEPQESKGVALISQSGAILFGITNVEQAFPLGYAISTGNQVNVDIAAAMEAVLDDPRVNAIGFYLEGLDDGDALATACMRAREMNIPVIALKGGNSPAGAAQAKSHSAAMVVDRDIWQAFARRYGIMEVGSPKALVETLKLLSICGVPNGPNITALSYSGGMNGVLSTRAEDAGIEFPTPSDHARSALKEQLPSSVRIDNPMDLNIPFRSSSGISMEDGESLVGAFRSLVDNRTDLALLFIDVPREEHDLDKPWLPSIQAIAELHKKSGIPCIVSSFMPDGLPAGLRQKLLNQGVAPMVGFDDTLLAIETAIKIRNSFNQDNMPSGLLSIAGQQQVESSEMLDEGQSKEWLASYDITMPDRWCGNPDDFGTAATSLTFPVVVKILSTRIAHKFKAGGVKLNIASPEEVQSAMREIAATVSEQEPNPRFLVESMVSNPAAEFIIGLKRDPAMGMVMVIGRGGVDVEIKAEFVTLLLPLEQRELDFALECLNTEGSHEFRRMVENVARFAEDQQYIIQELDINPVIITTDDTAIAADVLIVKAEGAR